MSVREATMMAYAMQRTWRVFLHDVMEEVNFPFPCLSCPVR
jgi:hypothetical protein